MKITDYNYSLYSLIASSVVLLIGDVLQITNHQNILWTICLAISFVLFVGGMPAINSFLSASNQALRLLINVFLLIGAIAGASMQVFFRTRILLENEKFTDAVTSLSNNPLMAFTTMVPGIFFPLGLILLSIALFIAGKIPKWKIVLLLLGAIAFPVGHAIGIIYALVLGDLLLLSAWIVIGAEKSTDEEKVTHDNNVYNSSTS